MLSRNGKNNSDGSFNWEDALIDAGITTMLAFGPGLGALAATGKLNDPTGWVVLLSTTLSEFFGFLAIKRKLKKEG